MTVVAMVVIGAVVVLFGGAGLFAWGLCRAAACEVPAYEESAAVPSRTTTARPRAICADCGRLVAVRLGDRLPYAGRHACRKVVPEVHVYQGEEKAV